MDGFNFIHLENLAIFRRRLAEAKDDATRKMLARLLEQEEAKDARGAKQN